MPRRQFRAAELRARRAVERLRTVRPASLRALEQADHDEQMLKDLVRKLAQFKSSLASETDAEQLIEASQAEIERTRRQSRLDLEEVTREVEEARRELRVATDAYRQLRREIDRLQPELAEPFAAEDRLLWDAEAHFPGGQLQLLAHEVDAGLNALRLAGQARAIRPAQGLDRPVPLLSGVARPRRRDDRGAPGAVAPRVPPAQVPVPPVRARLHRGIPPGLLDRLGGVRRRGPGATDPGDRERPAQPRCRVAVRPRSRSRVRRRPHRARTRPRRRAPAGRRWGPASRRPPGASRRPSPSSSRSSPAPASPTRASTSSWTSSSRPSRTSAPRIPDLLRLALPFREHISGDNGLDILRRNLERIQARRDENAARDEPEPEPEEDDEDEDE